MVRKLLVRSDVRLSGQLALAAFFDSVCAQRQQVYAVRLDVGVYGHLRRDLNRVIAELEVSHRDRPQLAHERLRELVLHLLVHFVQPHIPIPRRVRDTREFDRVSDLLADYVGLFRRNRV